MERVEGSKEGDEEEEESGVMECLLGTSSNSGYVQNTATITTIVNASIAQSPHSILHRDTLSLFYSFFPFTIQSALFTTEELARSCHCKTTNSTKQLVAEEKIAL